MRDHRIINFIYLLKPKHIQLQKSGYKEKAHGEIWEAVPLQVLYQVNGPDAFVDQIVNKTKETRIKLEPTHTSASHSI